MRSFETALPRYEEFARHHSGRVEGAEARLKMGLCLKETGRFKEAREVLASLAGGPFEPFAIAETAAIELHPDSQTPQRGLQMFKELLQRFPESSARFRINEVAQDNRRMGYHWNCETLAADAQICKELEQLGLRTSSRPAQTQMIHYRRLIRILMQLGQWREALQESREFTSRLQPAQLRAPQYQSPYIVAHVVNGLFEGLPTVSDLGQLQTFEAEFRMGFVPHVLVQRNEVQAFLDEFQPKVNSPEFKDTSLSYLVLFALLTQGRREEARQLIENNIMLNMGTNVFIHLRAAIAASDAQMESTLEKIIAAIPPGSHPGEERDFERVRGIVRARNALDFGNLSKAAAVLEGTTIMAPHFQIEEGFLLQLLLSTLGLIKSPTREELADRCATLLTGTTYDLSQMFLEKKAPRPNELWPHPLWRPEWRLWLALWLEARGDVQRAREVALPAVDKRFGLTNSQPALEALMERTRTAVNA
jgi:tetratricopeptide (TPR) repeat protein